MWWLLSHVLNRIGMRFAGRYVQMKIWAAYLKA
jgi:hypothetical protein